MTTREKRKKSMTTKPKKPKPNVPMFRISGIPEGPPIARIDTNNCGDEFNIRFPAREHPECAELCIGDNMVLLLGDPFDCDSLGQALILMAAEIERRGFGPRVCP